MEYTICDRLAYHRRHYGREDAQGTGMDACIRRRFGRVGGFLPTQRMHGSAERDAGRDLKIFYA